MILCFNEIGVSSLKMAVNAEPCRSKLILKYTMYIIVCMFVLVGFVTIRVNSLLFYFYSG
jgi:hypothetical protein